MTARLLSSRYDVVWGHGGWVTTLRCCSAYESFLRTYHRAVDATLAAEFLLLDRLFPRSVFWALMTAEQCLQAIDPSSTRTGLDNDTRRIIGRARTDLEFRPRDDLLGSLPEHLARLQDECSAAGAAIAHRHFRHTHSLDGPHEPPAHCRRLAARDPPHDDVAIRGRGVCLLQRGAPHPCPYRHPDGHRVTDRSHAGRVSPSIPRLLGHARSHLRRARASHRAPRRRLRRGRHVASAFRI